MKATPVMGLILVIGLTCFRPGDTRGADPAQPPTLEALRADAQAAASKLIVSDADVQIRFPFAPLIAAVSKLNALSGASRTINVQSTGANGKFWEDGQTWCHSYLELQGPSDLIGSIVLSNFAANPQPDGNINLGVTANVQIRVQAHWHFMGARFDIRVAGVKVGNACPPGGGFGGSVGASGATGLNLSGNLSLTQSSNQESLAYAFSLLAPRSANMTISIGFQHIGNLGIPMSFNLPVGILASGEFPMLILQEGSFTLPGGVKKTYAVALKPAGFATDVAGVSAKWKAAVSVK